jgi:hypothetical protein
MMFLVEFEGKKILFTGDGVGRDMLDILSEKNAEFRRHTACRYFESSASW